MRKWIMPVIAVSAAGCNAPAAKNSAALVEAGSGDACAAADTEAQLTAAIAPDTRAVKQQAADGDYPMRPADVDSLAQGLTYKIDSPALARLDKAAHAIACTAQLTIASSQYGVVSDPIPIAYRVALAPANSAAIIVTPIGDAARDGARAIFQQVAQKLSEVFRTQADQDAAASATDSMLAARPGRQADPDPLAAMANGSAAP